MTRDNSTPGGVTGRLMKGRRARGEELMGLGGRGSEERSWGREAGGTKKRTLVGDGLEATL